MSTQLESRPANSMCLNGATMIVTITHQTPGQTAMKGLFTEPDSNDETASSPNQGAMKKLFNQSAAPASPVMEKTVLQGVFAENDETEQPSTVESIFKGMADKSFSHYTTPSKKTPFESDQDIVSMLRLFQFKT